MTPIAQSNRHLPAWLVAVGLVACAQSAHANDEIQVYNGSIAVPGQFTIQQHLNYVGIGNKDRPFPGGLVSNNSLNGTPEFAYGITDWFELGLYIPFSVQDGRFYSNAAKIRTLFVTPNAADKSFFYGINFEFSNETPPFAQTRWSTEIRPIIGWRKADWEFIVNPIVDVGFGRNGEAHFTPAARLARKFGDDLYFGLEYYSDFGKIGAFSPLRDQQHTLFAVTDFKVGDFGVNFGVGFGLTPTSDKFLVKSIVGYAFPVPGAGAPSGEDHLIGAVNPMAHASVRNYQPGY
jgi:hypothetical protein